MGCHAGGIWRALLACTASAAMLFASAGPILSGHLAVDKACAPALVEAHDHAAHRLSRLPEPAPDHCAACHLTRSVRCASFVQILLALGLRQNTTVQPDGAAPHRAALRTDFTRGPPSR